MLFYSLVSTDIIILLKCSYCGEQSAILLLNWNETFKFLSYILLCAVEAGVSSTEIRFQYNNPFGAQPLDLIWAIFSSYASKVSQLSLFVMVGEKNCKRSDTSNSGLRRRNNLVNFHLLIFH